MRTSVGRDFQDVLLGRLMQQGVTTTLYMRNRMSLRGRIVRFDPYVILVEPADGTPAQLVYKSAIVAVSGPRGMGRSRRPGHGPHPRPRGGRPETAGS